MVYIKKNVNNLIIKILQSTSIRLHNVLVAHSNRYNEPGAMHVSHLSDALCLVDVPILWREGQQGSFYYLQHQLLSHEICWSAFSIVLTVLYVARNPRSNHNLMYWVTIIPQFRDSKLSRNKARATLYADSIANYG